MKNIVVYTKNNCPECVKTKEFLDSKKIEYTIVDVVEEPSAREFLMSQGLRSVPQIYVDGKLTVGGYRGLLKQIDSFLLDDQRKVA